MQRIQAVYIQEQRIYSRRHYKYRFKQKHTKVIHSDIEK